MLPESKLCSEKSEAVRRILKSCKSLVRTIVSIKNQVHGLLLGYGIESRKGDLQSVKKRQQILNVLAEHRYADATVKPLLETIDILEKEVNRLERVLIELVNEDRTVEVVMSIPGAGIITASTVSAYVDDINRFRTYKEFSSYAGLAPWVQTSNTTEHYGKVTKRGPETVTYSVSTDSIGNGKELQDERVRDNEKI